MIGDKSNLTDYKVCNTGPDIRFVGGELNPSLGFGNVKLGSITITDVLHVKGLKSNLLSMSQFVDMGYLVKIKLKFCKLIDNESKQTRDSM